MAPSVKRKGLGRGLDSLIPVSSERTQDNTTSSKNKGSKKATDDSNTSSKEKIVEKIVEVPVEKIVEVPVEKIVEVKVPSEAMVSIDDIEPNRFQPRKTFNEDSLQELMILLPVSAVGEQPALQVSKKYR